MSTILLVEARFYPHLNDMLLAGARAAIEAAGHKHETLTVPGALELPGAIALAARSGRFCAFVALGVVIRGETYHFEVVSEESARALMVGSLRLVEMPCQTAVLFSFTATSRNGSKPNLSLRPRETQPKKPAEQSQVSSPTCRMNCERRSTPSSA